MPNLTITDASHRLRVLGANLSAIVKHDPESDVRGMAVPVLESVVEASREWVPESDAVLQSIRDVMVVDTIIGTRIVRASDALIIVGQMQAAPCRRSEGPPEGKPHASGRVRQESPRHNGRPSGRSLCVRSDTGGLPAKGPMDSPPPAL